MIPTICIAQIKEGTEIVGRVIEKDILAGLLLLAILSFSFTVYKVVDLMSRSTDRQVVALSNALKDQSQASLDALDRQGVRHSESINSNATAYVQTINAMKSVRESSRDV